MRKRKREEPGFGKGRGFQAPYRDGFAFPVARVPASELAWLLSEVPNAI